MSEETTVVSDDIGEVGDIDVLRGAFRNEEPQMIDQDVKEPQIVEETKEPEPEPEVTPENKESQEPEKKDYKRMFENALETLSEERDRKRAAQIELEELRKKPKAKEEFDWENPNSSIDKAKAELRQEMQAQFLSMSEAHAKARHNDYDEKYAAFAEMAQSNPALAAEALRQPDPAEFCYREGEKKLSMADIGDDVSAWKEKMRAEIKAELKAEMENKTVEDKIQKLSNLPPSAAGLPGKGNNSREPVVLDDPLGKVLGDR